MKVRMINTALMNFPERNMTVDFKSNKNVQDN